MTHPTIQTADRVMMPTYLRQPLLLVKGEGATVRDADGNAYLDFLAGIAVCNLGHAHPRVAEAVARQAATLCHVSNLYYTEPQTALAQWLTDHSFADRVFFCNSGAEANEAAIKLARRYFHEKGEPERHRIICMEKSFHGRTMAALSATGQDKIKTGFSPVLQGFDFVPFNDLAALDAAVGPNTCGVMLEPVQGEGGVRCPEDGYLEGVRKLCDDRGILLIFDEIQTGIGRTGTLFAYEHFGIAPDIMTLAKALANGFPIGAALAKEAVAQAFGPGAHASTFGGTPVITAAALATLKVLTEEGVLTRSVETGAYFREQLEALQARHEVAVGVRGMGLLLGLELSVPGGPAVGFCREKGFLINCIQDTVLRFAPPLIIEPAEIDALIRCLDDALADLGR